MRRRMIVCDLDGTLLDSTGGVSSRTVRAVRRARRDGHVFVIATARPVRGTREVARLLDGEVIAVCGNGSLVYDFGREEIVAYHPLLAGTVGKLLDLLRQRFPDVRFGAECGLELVLEERFELPAALCRDARRVARMTESVSTAGFGKLMVQLGGPVDGYFDSVRELLGGYEVTVSGGGFCEVMTAGVTKAAALGAIADRMGFPRADVVAFGDMLNDLPVFAWSGTSVAVANAHPTVLAAADEITASNDDSGVARWIERMCTGSSGPVEPPTLRS